MKTIVVLLVAVIVSVNANCGCLKCSKHIGLANEYCAEPRYCGPVKILFRGQKYGDNLCQGYNKYEKEYGASGGCSCGGYPGYCTCTYPITVQKPVVPSTSITPCVPLVGLKACIDRVVLPSPGPKYTEPKEPKYNYCSAPLLQALDLSEPYDNSYTSSCSCRRYENNLLPLYCNCNVKYNGPAKTRSKREVPILKHGYKFFVNMLPPFMKEPMGKSINMMASAHPEYKNEKKTKYRMTLPTPVPSTVRRIPSLKDKILEKKYERKVADIRSFMKKTKNNPLTRSNNVLDSGQLIFEESDPHAWLRELRPSEIFDEKPLYQSFFPFVETHRLSQGKRVPKRRMKRSIIMDSEEFSVPLYQFKIDDDPYEFDDNFETSSTEEEPVLQKSLVQYSQDPREIMIRNAIKDELRKFKKVDHNFGYNKMVPQNPIFHLITLPLKLFRGIGNKNESPLIAFPKMLVQTKKYLKDFGKNFKKHALHFASDIIGDFDHEPYGNQFMEIIRPSRYKRQIPLSETEGTEITIKVENQNRTKPFTHQLDPDYKNVFNDGSVNTLSQTECNQENEHFRDTTDNKVRKKRYIVKIVDEDEVEEYLRKKIGKLYNIPQKERYPQYIEERHSDEETWTVQATNNFYNGNHKYRNNGHYPQKRVVVEKVKPKVIIDNNGLPFMEMNGFKRPIFTNLFRQNLARDHDREIVGSPDFIPIDSSEEVNRDKIDHIIGFADKDKKHRNNDIPINTIKKKMSDLLQETDVLLHIDFWKYHDIYDKLLELQNIKLSIVQDWKKIVMEKRINDHKVKVLLLGKFKSMQNIKDIAVQHIVNAMYEESSNSFILNELVKSLVKLHKLQCVINKVVGCIEEKFKMSTKFDIHNEIKLIDFLVKLNFANEKTRNDMILKLKNIRDETLKENIKLLDKLKKSLIEEDETCIEDEANLIWEMKNIEKMRKHTIDEMHDKLMNGYRIKKHLKIIFDLTKRLQTCDQELRDDCRKQDENDESKENDSEEDGKSSNRKTIKKLNVDEIKQKIQEKMEKYKEMLQERKEKLRKKYAKNSDEDE